MLEISNKKFGQLRCFVILKPAIELFTPSKLRTGISGLSEIMVVSLNFKQRFFGRSKFFDILKPMLFETGGHHWILSSEFGHKYRVVRVVEEKKTPPLISIYSFKWAYDIFGAIPWLFSTRTQG